MEQAFATGDTPVGLSAQMHTAALAWTPPGFAAFYTGRIGDEADGVDSAETQPAAETAETEPTEPAADTGTAPADAPPAANGTADAGDAVDETDGIPAAGPSATDEQVGVANHAGPIDGRDPSADPLEIPEFLRRVH